MTTIGATRRDLEPRLATDAKGTWTVTWSRGDCCGNEETDIYFGQSYSNDFTFVKRYPPHPHFDTDTEGDACSALATDTLGNWLMLFWTGDTIDGTFGADYDIFSLCSADNGETWSAPQPVNSTAAADSPSDHDTAADLTTDGRGTWVAAWRSYNSLDNTIGSDPDILFATTAVTGTLRGVVQDAATSALVDCAALVITDVEPDIEAMRIVPANKVGEFEAPNLAPGNYVIRLYSATHESAVKSVTIEEGKTVFVHFPVNLATFTQGIRGVVTDVDNGKPLVGVHVMASIDGTPTDETYTCGDGEYAFRNLPTLKASVSVKLQFRLPNYTVKDQDVVFNPGAISEADTQLSKGIFPGTIAGSAVSSATNEGIPNVRITLLGRSNISTETNAAGLYAIPAIPEGRYSIDASAKGFQSSTVSHSVPNGDSIEVNFVLTPVSAGMVGDVNLDNLLDAVDVQLVINGALGLAVAFNVDTDNDGQINAVDVQRVINAVLER
ncbi:MAG: carboxypeptidase regulatory-like domain-containing protein [Candidatus Hydrogenedentes bacterium]|nr:carboxypeptidase regulatory-like domain-containing protein [Candidatus Hydrogenedentota bacterium]